MHGPAAVILPSRNEAATIGQVTEAIDRSLETPALAIINADASEDDRTHVAFESAVTRSPKISLRCAYRGKGHQVCEAGKQIDSRVEIVLICDTDTRQANPQVYTLLRNAVVGGADLAIANYTRSWFDGNLTNHLVRPLLLFILGDDIPQPISGDLALSRKGFAACQHAMNDLHDSELQKCAFGYGIDSLFIYATALNGGKIKSVDIAVTKLHAPSFPHMDKLYWETAPILLSPRFRKIRRAVRSVQFTYRINDQEKADIPAMISGLKQLMSSAIGDDRPWHEQLLEAVNRARNDHEAIQATKWLWPRYVQRLCEYLEIGQRSGLSDATKTLVQELSAIGARAIEDISDYSSSLREAK